MRKDTREEIEVLIKEWYFDGLYIVLVGLSGYLLTRGVEVIWQYLVS